MPSPLRWRYRHLNCLTVPTCNAPPLTSWWPGPNHGAHHHRPLLHPIQSQIRNSKRLSLPIKEIRTQRREVQLKSHLGNLCMLEQWSSFSRVWAQNEEQWDDVAVVITESHLKEWLMNGWMKKREEEGAAHIYTKWAASNCSIIQLPL